MQIGISNIGWNPEDVTKNTELALSLGFDYIESAYIKTPLSRSVYAIQGVFYGSGIKSFDDPQCYQYCCDLIDFCLSNEIKIITLGSPSMRTGNKKFLLDLVSKLDEYINKRNCVICIEPNASKYGGEYYYSLDEIVPDISDLNNIKTMIDTGNLYAESIDPVQELEKYFDFIYHCHFSTTDLNPIADYDLYKDIFNKIKTFGYNKSITYEYMNSYSIKSEMNNFLNMF
jgi:sugar phosphate isomerase/epimerase